jgi:hypothetical protein
MKMAKAKVDPAAQLHDALLDDLSDMIQMQGGDPSRVVSLILSRLAREPRLTPPALPAEPNATVEGADAPVLPGE